MAVSKLWAVNSRLGQVIDYAANPEKTAADIYTEEQYQAIASSMASRTIDYLVGIPACSCL